MIDNLSITEKLTLIVRRAAELAEHILRIARTALGHFLAKIFEQEIAPCHAAPHCSAGQRNTDYAN